MERRLTATAQLNCQQCNGNGITPAGSLCSCLDLQVERSPRSQRIGQAALRPLGTPSAT